MDTRFWCPRAKTGGPAAGVGRLAKLTQASDDRWPGEALFVTPGGVECERLPIGSTLGRLPYFQTTRKKTGHFYAGGYDAWFWRHILRCRGGRTCISSLYCGDGFPYPGAVPKPLLAGR